MMRRHKKPGTNERIPRVWMMTDPRFNGDLMAALQRLPAKSGVIFRHYELPATQRRKLLSRVARVCRRRGHVLLLAGAVLPNTRMLASGRHGQPSVRRYPPGICSAPVHNVREIAKARRSHADIMLLSPIFATRSHRATRPMGAAMFMQLAALCRPAKVIALGGMTAARAAMFSNNRIHGWAAIDAFVKNPDRQ